MNKFIALTKVLLKTGGSSLQGKNKKNKINSFIGKVILLLLILVPVTMSIGSMASGCYNTLNSINQAGIMIAFSIAITCQMVFLFGIIYIMNIFYFSDDVETLLSLPLKPSLILGSKFTVVLIYEYYLEVMFLAPVLVVYGIKSSASILYYVYMILVGLMIPIVPLVLSSLLTMVLMRFANISKSRDKFNMFMGIFALMIGIGVNVYMQKFSRMSSKPEQLLDMIQKGNNSMTSIVAKIFPSTTPAINSLVNNGSMNGLLNFLMFLLITVAAILVFFLFAEKLYFKGAMGANQSSSKRKALTGEQLNKTVVKSSVVKSYMFKELKLLFRTPAYFINCIVSSLIWPVFMFIPFMFGENKASLSTLSKFNIDNSIKGMILIIAIGVTIFIGTSNMVSLTAISREGRNIFFMKFIPVKYSIQILAKVMAGVLISLIDLIVIIAVAVILFKMPADITIALIVMGFMSIIFINFAAILFDLISPKLDWDDEQRLMKQNFKSFAGTMLSMAMAGLCIFIGINLRPSFNIALLTSFLVFAVLDILIYIIVGKIAESKMNKLNA